MATCTLVIKDEVNVRLEGLAVDTRRELNRKFKYPIPGARYIPAVRLGRWDGCETFFQLGGSTYINLLPEILPILSSRGYDIDLDDQRHYTRSFDFTPIDENYLCDRSWPVGHPMEGQPILLRDYQLSAINEFLTNTQSIQCISTGAGKTIITATLARCVEQHGRSLLIVPSKNLVTQTEEDYINIGLDVGVVYGDRKQFHNQHLICTWQSLNSLLKDHPEHLLDILKDLVCVMVDECFDGESMVLTPTGYIPIKEVRAGDKVINYCEKTNQFKIDTVIKQHKNLTNSMSEKMYELEFDNGSKIKVTGNHKILTNKGWVRADQITNDMEIISLQA